MEKKKYTKPKVEIVNFTMPDIITGSIGDSEVPELPNGLNEEEDI